MIETLDIPIRESAHQCVRDVVDSLGAPYAKVILDSFINGKSLREIGRDLGVSAGRIHQVRAQALRRLRHPVRLEMLRDAALVFSCRNRFLLAGELSATEAGRERQFQQDRAEERDRQIRKAAIRKIQMSATPERINK